jgi:hypothetical protein
MMLTRRRRSRLLTGALLLALLSGWILTANQSPVRAQTGTFTGRVIDLLTQKAIRGATVRVGNLTATSDSQGRYRLAAPAGMYEVQASAEGYIGMSLVRQSLAQGGSSLADFEMVVASPTASQRAALDLLFQPSEGPQLSPEELESLRVQGFAASNVVQLPSTIRVLMPDGIVVTMSLDDYVRGVLPRLAP